MRTIGLEEVTKKMKITDARIEAKRRWGIMSFATVSRIHRSARGETMKGVGKRVYYPATRSEIKEFYGWGETWEIAFAEADKHFEKATP